MFGRSCEMVNVYANIASRESAAGTPTWKGDLL
jgi:hypothetical protein